MSGTTRDEDSRRRFLVWQLPRLLFTVSALWLVIVAAAGWPLFWLYSALVLFGLCSLVFIARQIWRGHRPRPGLVVTSAIMCAVGIVLLVTYFFVRGDVLPPLGSVLLVLGLGWLVEAWREARQESTEGLGLRRWGIILAIVAAVLFVGTVVPFLSGSVWPSVPLLVILAVGLLVILPVALNLLSEFGLRWLRRPQRRPEQHGTPSRQIVRAGYGILALAAIAVVFLFAEDWVLTASLAALAVVLILAIVSSTHADVAIVLALLALLSAAPRELALPDPLTSAAGTKTLVALGDSYMSGEGASSYYAGTDDAGGDQCRRAPTAYAPSATVEEGRFDQLAFLACSGARTYNIIATPDDPAHAQVQTGEDGTQVDQIERLKKANAVFHPALVIVGVGGNDAGFATLGETCIAPGDCSTQRALFENNLPKVERALVATYSSIKKALPGVPILAVPYPQPIADRGRCDGVALTKAERDFIRGFLHQLDSRIQAAAARSGILYLADMERSLESRHLQLCDARKSAAGINFLDLHSVNGIASQRFNPARWLHNSLHPNERGHRAMLETLDAWLDENLATVAGGATAPGPGTPAAPVVPAGTVAEPDPPCSMTVGDGTSCQEITRRWETEQLRDFVSWRLPVLIVVLLVIWAASIVVLSRLRLKRQSSPSQGRPSRRRPTGDASPPDRRAPVTTPAGGPADGG